MCDYSLLTVKSRPAKVGDKLFQNEMARLGDDHGHDIVKVRLERVPHIWDGISSAC
jgi:hypothetical protein